MPIADAAIQFIQTFDYIVQKCSHNPKTLERIANQDPKVREAAELLTDLASSPGFEDDSKEKFARNVPHAFLKRWDEFKDTWEAEVRSSIGYSVE